MITPRMVVADVDGTLMGRAGHVTPRVRAAIRAAIERGILVTLATGRWFRSAQPIAAELGLALPIVLHNGALVKDSRTGAVLDDCHLPIDCALAAIAIIRAHGLQPIIYENAFAGETLIAGPSEGDSPAAARYLATKLDHLRRVPLDRLLLHADPLQIAVADESPAADALVRDLLCDRWRTVTSMTLAVPDARFVEVLGRECSKAAAIERLAARFGIRPDEIMAVGDNFNDLDMIEAAGIGVAMGNAPAGVRDRADWVAPSVDADGLAVAIERFVLDAAATGPGRPGGEAGSSG